MLVGLVGLKECRWFRTVCYLSARQCMPFHEVGNDEGSSVQLKKASNNSTATDCAEE